MMNPPELRPLYKQPQIITLVLVAAFIIASLFGVDTSKIVDDVDSGLNDAQQIIDSVNEFSDALSAPSATTQE